MSTLTFSGTSTTPPNTSTCEMDVPEYFVPSSSANKVTHSFFVLFNVRI